MNQKKLWVGMSLAAVLAMGAALAGCTDKKETPAASGKTDDKAPAKRGDITVTMYDRGAVPASEGSYEENRWTKWINQNGPVNVKYVPVLRSESTKKLNVLFASGSAPDVINEYNTPFRHGVYEQKQLLPLDDYLKFMPEYQKLLTQFPQLKKAGTKPDGKLYEIGKLKEASPLHVFFIRTDWLKKLNLPMPTTAEEMMTVAKAFADQDPDGNGKKDTYGMNISTYSETALNEMFGDSMSKSQISWGIKDGKVVRLWENELASLSFKKRLYDDGIIDKDYINDKDGAKAKQDFLNGKIGIYINSSVSWFDFAINDLATLKKNAPGAEVAPLPYPKSQFGQFTGAIDNPVQMTTVVNAKAKDPEAVMRYLDFMMKPETGIKITFGDENVHWKKGANGCPQIIDPAKSKNEVGYAGDYEMFLTRATDKCSFVVNQFNPDVPEQKAGLELYKEAQKTYLDPSRQYPGITIGEHMPPFPNDLNVIHTSLLKDMTDIYVKAIISGSKYSPEQAIKDAQSAWDKAGGKQLEDYMNKWYSENKDKAFLAKDVWDIVKQQKDQFK
ncbi:hypothetical protein GCM10023310_12520 [Paenibacillus vulneris]|uniref:Extracellular solute-binding protein n=1 Tax=Paenibacillus vulneris TaxID=1133364 RepID=A0ABW3UKS5_9BACL|nr:MULTISPECIES: extracellular solute-binding protein [unclassified Paenibacillus]MBE1441468.1 putative aldouronate transport system substrate-binding protein [Paenibacillus sp. OAS669]